MSDHCPFLHPHMPLHTHTPFPTQRTAAPTAPSQHRSLALFESSFPQNPPTTISHHHGKPRNSRLTGNLIQPPMSVPHPAYLGSRNVPLARRAPKLADSLSFIWWAVQAWGDGNPSTPLRLWFVGVCLCPRLPLTRPHSSVALYRILLMHTFGLT